MQTLTFLNTRDIKKIRQLFEDTYGSFFTGDYTYLQGKDGRLSLINKDIAQIDLKKLRVDKFGLYVGEIKAYFHGVDLRKDLGAEARFVLIEYKGDIVGCSKYKEGVILNYLPKIHRGEVIV